MKINIKHIAGLMKEPQMQVSLMEEQKKFAKENYANFPISEDDKNAEIEDAFTKLFSGKGTKSYIIKEDAQTVIGAIKLDGSFDLKIFKKIPNEQKEIILNRSELFRYYNDGEIMRVLYVTIDWKTLWTSYHSFTIMHSENSYSPNYYEREDVKEKCHLFMKMLVFLHFSEISEVFLKPNGKIGSHSTGRYKNETKHPFIVVNTKWNITSIRTEGFSVRGHFRLQPCGKENQDRKLIFIEEFEKQGYVRKAKSLEHNN